jgi:hypothetical protein
MREFDWLDAEMLSYRDGAARPDAETAARARPGGRRILFASTAGAVLGALGAATLLPALPALMFGAAIGAYSGFLAAAMDALGSGEIGD